jgi:hypothetical protein
MIRSFLIRVFGAAPDGSPALDGAEVVHDNAPAEAPEPAREVRLQVAVGTVPNERTGEPMTIWADVQLVTGHLHLVAGVWTCSPAEFGRRYAERTARYLDGERVVMAGDSASTGGAEVPK